MCLLLGHCCQLRTACANMRLQEAPCSYSSLHTGSDARLVGMEHSVSAIQCLCCIVQLSKTLRLHILQACIRRMLCTDSMLLTGISQGRSDCSRANGQEWLLGVAVVRARRGLRMGGGGSASNSVTVNQHAHSSPPNWKL